MIRPGLKITDDPRPIDDLTYTELVEMIEIISEPETEEELGDFYARLIECTLPGANVMELIFWPNEWFQDGHDTEFDLSSSEMANYVMAWTGKRLLGAEAIELPEIPDSLRDGRANEIG